MKLWIDNMDGAGAMDYTPALSKQQPLRVERKLNAISTCAALLDVDSVGLAKPIRKARVIVANDAGTTLFTGYLTTEPVARYAGVSVKGPVYHWVISAASDEWLLNQLGGSNGVSGLGQNAGDVLTMLSTRTGTATLATSGIGAGLPLGVYLPGQGEAWSASAGEAAGNSYAAYRAVGGQLMLQSVATVTHTFYEGDGTLDANALTAGKLRELANDVTLSGEREPAALVQEIFTGDGTTDSFYLNDAPLRSSPATLIRDAFDAAAIDDTVWAVNDPGTYVSLTGAGLTLNGGNGLDGQTTVQSLNRVEMGGALLVEASHVVLATGSDGVLCGLYQGVVSLANLFAGFRVKQVSGATVLQPVVNGSEVGSPFAVVSGHVYTLRLRAYCVEMQRVKQTYYAMVDGGVQQFGGGLVEAPMAVTFEVQDLGLSSATPVTVLYDGLATSSPSSAVLVAVNSVQMFGSVGGFRLVRSGSAWVVSTLPDGTKQTRLQGATGEGVDCSIDSSGKVSFYSGRVPVAGERVTVFYRMGRRAVARMADAASVAEEAALGLPGLARWVGKVRQPKARSTEDCEAAAQAVLSFAVSRAAAQNGSYVAVNPPEDVWPGDMLTLASSTDAMNVIVRQVVMEDQHCVPEMVRYTIQFANDWAESLSMTLNESVATDAVLPKVAATTPATALANLQQVTVVGVTETMLQMDAGVSAPSGGGFEVRRRDWSFGAGADGDLVLRSPVRSFEIPRAAKDERYFIRMYDGSSPPVYSRFSAAVFTHVPVG
ncbi:hypothetical protein [Terriglobus tenax]|uniref:hypothetical protein n=1 Tax=Terriglobus tenax TaxID=1111115 RepID=UPI0021E04DA9|nr:hypothetical protein [Terriglobus tenax]